MTYFSNPSEVLAQAIQEDSNREQDWLWYAEQVENDVERCYCLERALYINPKNRSTQIRVTELRKASRPANGLRWNLILWIRGVFNRAINRSSPT
jgi:hypothetical protein